MGFQKTKKQVESNVSSKIKKNLRTSARQSDVHIRLKNADALGNLLMAEPENCSLPLILFGMPERW